MNDLPKVFIATTAETMEEGWFDDTLTNVNTALEKQGHAIELQPWNIAFNAGDITAERLIALAHELLGAIVVLTGDDYTRSRDDGTPAPRDNLIFEAGLFISDLGLKHVLLLREEGSKWPSDLLGVTSKPFTKPSAAKTGNAVIAALGIAKEIKTFVADLAKPVGSAEARALHNSSTRFGQQSRELKANVRVVSSETPVHVRDATLVYLDAVNGVDKTFATTTYLDSNFWTSRDIEILTANESMLERVQSVKGSARRLILLSRPIDDELARQRRLRLGARSKDPEKYEQMNSEYREFASATRNLIQKGFSVSVVYDRDRAYSQLPDDINFNVGDTELALYDNARVDIFSGFTSKRRSNVDVYLGDKYVQFEALQKSVQGYFDKLWKSKDATDFSTFDDGMRTVIDEVEDEIDYTKNWLYRYDKAKGEDGDLKTAESGLVLHYLKEQHGSLDDIVSSHIDLGTCTGRYINMLRPACGEQGTSVGLDNDPDCIAMLQLKQAWSEIDGDVEIRHGDIRREEELPQEKFDVVTCMMGTLCHLKRNGGSEPFEDEWQTGLNNVAKLMAKDGDAFVAVWNKQAPRDIRGERRFLEIYETNSNQLLCDRSPSMSELQSRVTQANMKIENNRLLKTKLRVLHLRHAKAKPRS